MNPDLDRAAGAVANGPETSEDQPAILIVDDEFSVRDSLESWFKKDGYRTGVAAGGREALERLEHGTWDVILLDIKMPDIDGLELQRRIRQTDPEATVIMITACATVDTAVQSLKEGAFDYVTKPFDPGDLSRLVRKAVERSALRRENRRLKSNVEQLVMPAPIVGDSPAIRKVLETVASVAATDSTVLIRGESGTGKELIAQAIHGNSRRRYFPLIPVNCGALPESLLESELFGHERGAFTGAQYRRKGKLELADGGTLFLDEVGTISPRTQVDLLRVIETKEFMRVGGSKPIRVDFRVVAATNQPLEELIKLGQFREDLYWRLNVLTLSLPPLRERREDIPLLVAHFIEKYALQMNKPFRECDPEALDLLVRHDWPGNVRELANAIERAMVVGRPPAVRAADLPLPLLGSNAAAAGDSLEDMEHAHIAKILEREGGNVTRSANLLGIDRVTLYNKIKKYGLRR